MSNLYVAKPANLSPVDDWQVCCFTMPDKEVSSVASALRHPLNNPRKTITSFTQHKANSLE